MFTQKDVFNSDRIFLAQTDIPDFELLNKLKREIVEGVLS
jgi:hypothetical protein